MSRISSFSALRTKALKSEPSRLAVAGGNDKNVMQAVISAVSEGLVSKAFVTGNAEEIRTVTPENLRDSITAIPAGEAPECAEQAVALVRENQVDLLMKGHVDSTSYLRSIVNKESGIRVGSVLSNITIAEMPSLPKLIGATDNGIVPAPTLDQKRQIILNARALFRGLGIDPVKVAALAATEKVSDKLPATADASALTAEALNGSLPGCVVDGPFGYDVAISTKAAEVKNLEASLVAGDADLLLFPTIDAANAVAKSWKFHGQAKTGSVVVGAKVPVMLNSRSDDTDKRINALLLAIAMKLGAENGS